MKNLRKSLISFVVVGSLLVGCSSLPPANEDVSEITLSRDFYLWSDFSESDLVQPLGEFYDSDILSRQTAEDILNLNPE